MITSKFCTWLCDTLVYTIPKSFIDAYIIYLNSGLFFRTFPSVQTFFVVFEPCIHNANFVLFTPFSKNFTSFIFFSQAIMPASESFLIEPTLAFKIPHNDSYLLKFACFSGFFKIVVKRF